MADFSEILEKLYDAVEAGKDVRLSRDEADELLWQLNELDLAIEMQRHMIGLLERRPLAIVQHRGSIN